MTSTRYIFDPAVIETALADRAHLRGAIRPELLAQRPDGFPLARCSPWQIARILGATDRYAGPALVADDLEQCLAAGLALPWLRTTSCAQLRAGLAEARTACELLRHGFVLEELDLGNSQDRVPEFAARDDKLEIAVEVYAPREWQRLADLTDALSDHLRHLDAPVEYDIELIVGPLTRFDDRDELASLHPGPVDAGLTDDVCELAMESVVGRILAGLRSGRDTAKATHSISSLNLKIHATLTDIRPAIGLTPRRERCIHYWPASGYAPEGMFERLARRRVRHKMRRGQAAAAGLAASLLVVDLGHFPLVEEWDHDFYDRAFSATLERHIAPDTMGHDAIAFCDASGPLGRLRTRYSVVADAAPKELVQLLEKLVRTCGG